VEQLRIEFLQERNQRKLLQKELEEVQRSVRYQKTKLKERDLRRKLAEVSGHESTRHEVAGKVVSPKQASC
jgi:hypothetical protein